VALGDIFGHTSAAAAVENQSSQRKMRFSEFSIY